MGIKDIIEFIKKPSFLIGLGIVLLILFMVMLARILKKKKLVSQIAECEVLYNNCISVPLSFKINRARSIAKLNPAIEDELNQANADYVELEKRFKEISTILEEVEDAISFGKLGFAEDSVSDLISLVEETEVMSLELDNALDKMLEEEAAIREIITDLKDVFRSDKAALINSMNLYGQSYDALDATTKDIEDKFSNFEEWMYANDYEKAKELIDEIKVDLDRFKFNLNEIPTLYDMSRGKIPHLLDAISSSYQDARNQNIYLNHMDVPKTIIYMSDRVKENLKKISNLELEEAKTNLDTAYTALEAMGEAIEKEFYANVELQDKMRSSFAILDEFVENVDLVKAKADVIVTRFDFEGFEDDLRSYELSAQELLAQKDRIESLFEANETPATKQIHLMNELIETLDNVTEPFNILMNDIAQANADEIRAENQLKKLYLIINDVEVRIKKRSLPSISERYIHDLERSRAYAHQINALLNEDILDIAALNGTVAEAIDYIYQLHNNVNNLVGVVDMCENSIVYANKYRAYVPDIDSELTKAELAFNNGEYTQSLTMIINAIERFKPNTSYEEMIKNNARSA